MVGCKGQEALTAEKDTQRISEENSTEKYREISAALPKDVGKILAIRQVDEKLWLISPGQIYYSLDMGETWVKAAQETAWIPEQCSMAAISRNGAFAFYSKELGITLCDGETKKEIGKVWENQEEGASFSFVNETVAFITDTSSNVYIIDLNTGNLVKTIAAEHGFHYAICAVNNEILALTEQGIVCYDEHGKQVDANDKVNDAVNSLLLSNLGEYSSGKQMIFAEDINQNGMFFALKNGLYHYKLEGSIVEQIADGSANLMGDNRYSFYRMAAVSEKTTLIAYRDGEANIVLKRYEYASDNSNEEGLKGDLTIYSLYEDDLLSQEINVFAQKYPECTVNLEIGISDGLGITVSDAIQTLNTAIMAGAGPDILILDGLPIEKLIDRNILLDVTEEVERVADKEGIYEHIAAAYLKNERMYAIPARFRIPVMAGDKKVIDKIKNLDSLVQTVRDLKAQNPDLSSIVGLYNKNLLEYLFDFCSPAWAEKNGNMDYKKLEEFYKAAKNIQDIQKEGVPAEEITLISDILYSDDNEELDKAIDVSMGKQLLALYNSKSLNFSKTLFDEQQKNALVFESSRGQSTNVFIPKEVLGINALSQNQSLARKFFEEFLSSECQSRFAITDMSYPINTTAFQKQMKDELEMAENESDRKIYKEGFKKIENIILQLDKCCITDAVIRDTVADEGMRYISEEQSLEETLNRVTQKLNIYMSE